MTLKKLANEIIEYLAAVDGVVRCSLYGSLADGGADDYSDIDLELDVSGRDNGAFALALPTIVSVRFPVLFADYSPSLMPEKYIVTLALSQENPFLMLDINCVASPHCAALSREDFPFDHTIHTLKLLSANVKHFLRGQNCEQDVARMYRRVLGEPGDMSTLEMLRAVQRWLLVAAAPKYAMFIRGIGTYLYE